ncbi:hypothetical protein CLHUN_42110 [Ruminiclostridium hungatei]|uniref:Uncharacterized protein n=1 Tax=Ruminiclostridium hungatei TaxID=48256 RepID=A0A1V4SDD3_RUMHU|nr:hypothetical protein CLHUN_42110 [Ruminiclostridium hungatei]
MPNLITMLKLIYFYVDETKQVSKNQYEVYTTIKLEETNKKNNLKAEKRLI